MDDDAIRELVIRLARSGGRGGHTIERATLRAEGIHLSEIVRWIEVHGTVRYLLPAGSLS